MTGDDPVWDAVEDMIHELVGDPAKIEYVRGHGGGHTLLIYGRPAYHGRPGPELVSVSLSGTELCVLGVDFVVLCDLCDPGSLDLVAAEVRGALRRGFARCVHPGLAGPVPEGLE